VVVGIWCFGLGGNDGAAEGAAAAERWPGLSCDNASRESNKQAMPVKVEIVAIAM